MLFNSSSFLFGFLPIVLAGFALLSRFQQTRLAGIWLTGASLFFYGWWNPLYLPLLVGSMLFNYVLGGYLLKKPSQALLALGIAVNIALLGYYKYTGFLVQTVLATRQGSAIPPAATRSSASAARSRSRERWSGSRCR